MTEKKPRIDMSKLSDDQKEAVAEVIEFFERRGVIPCNIVAEEAKQRFNLKDVPTLKVSDSLWYKMTKGTNIDTTYQGYTDKIQEDGSVYRSPYVAISVDIEELDAWLAELLLTNKG